jgi:hypothetical protein
MAQSNTAAGQPATMPLTMAPAPQPGAPTNAPAPMTPNSTDPTQVSAPISDTAKEVPSPDSVLTKLKQNASPVTINDMIEAQDVLTRLDLIGQIEDKQAKIDDLRNKNGGGFGGMGQNSNPAPINQAPPPPIVNTAALDALREASASSPSLPPVSSGSTQILTINGSDGNYSALLQHDGHQLNVKVGSAVLGLGTISSIDPKQIVITKPDGKTTKLGFTEN